MVVGLRGTGKAIRGAVATTLVFALVPLWLASCGGESRDTPSGANRRGGTGGTDGSSGSGGSSGGSGSPTSGGAMSGGAMSGGATSGGATSGGATSGGATTGGSSGSPEGGDAGEPVTGGSSGNGGNAGGGAGSGGSRPGGAGGSSGSGSSVGGEGPAPGFPCFDQGDCVSGTRCVTCRLGEVDYTSFCAPDPDKDPNGYETATEDCIEEPRYSDCDGPEDCPQGKYCAYTTSNFRAHCVTESDLPTVSTCCFTCDAAPICTLCWNDSDCPEALVCVQAPVAPRGVGGCRVPQ
jgi:hypothetical protein